VEFGAACCGGEGEEGRGEVVGEYGAGESCDQGGGGAESSLVGILKSDGEVCEVWGRGESVRGCVGVVIVVGEDGNGGGFDGDGEGGDVGEGVEQGGLYELVWRGGSLTRTIN
jgi:hypothetical protein